MHNLIVRTVICTDPEHQHRTPRQEMMAFDHAGHHIEITKDGGYYNAFVDDELFVKWDMTAQQLEEYLQPYLKGFNYEAFKLSG